LAGTWKQYSKKAIDQLTRTTFQSASWRKRRWPYQAKVMKMLEMVRRITVHIIGMLDAICGPAVTELGLRVALAGMAES
jgi:hypothetical protein